GIRIRDAALVAAARLSARYITDRHLPDKAIDLVDEAASRLKMEIESLPTPIDQVERRIVALEIERQALAKERDKVSKARHDEVGREIAALREQANTMRAQWQREKELIGEVQRIKAEIDQVKTEMDLVTRRGDLNKAAELRYGRLPELEKQLTGRNAALVEMQ